MNILKKKSTYQLVAVFIFFLCLSSLIPLTGDDWTWKSSRGMERFYKFFDNYNGRYISNLLEIGSTRISLFRILLMTFFSTVLIVFISIIIFEKRWMNRLFVVLCLVMVLPLSVFAQTFGWTAGYVNYVTSVVLILLFLLIYRYILRSTEYDLSVALLLMLFLISYSSALFVEHVTLYLLFLSLCVNIYYIYINKLISKPLIISFVGFFLGSITMFSNSAYISIFIGEDDYRTVKSDEGFIERAIDIYIYQMNYHFNVNNVILMAVLLIAILIFFYYMKDKKLIDYILLTPFISNFIIVLINNHSLSEFRRGSDLYLISSITFILGISGLIIFILKNFREQSNYYSIIFYMCSAIFLTLPFLVITPYGGRCAFGSFIFIIIIILEIYKNIGKKLSQNYKGNLLEWNNNKVIFILTFSIMVSYLYPIYYNKMTELDRNQIVINEKSKNEIHLPLLPYPNFHQMPDPKEDVYMTQFYKKLYGVDKDTKFIFDK